MQVSELERVALSTMNGSANVGAEQDPIDEEAEEDLDSAISARLDSVYRAAGVGYPAALP